MTDKRYGSYCLFDQKRQDTISVGYHRTRYRIEQSVLDRYADIQLSDWSVGGQELFWRCDGGKGGGSEHDQMLPRYSALSLLDGYDHAGNTPWHHESVRSRTLSDRREAQDCLSG